MVVNDNITLYQTTFHVSGFNGVIFAKRHLSGMI